MHIPQHILIQKLMELEIEKNSLAKEKPSFKMKAFSYFIPFRMPYAPDGVYQLP